MLKNFEIGDLIYWNRDAGVAIAWTEKTETARSRGILIPMRTACTFLGVVDRPKIVSARKATEFIWIYIPGKGPATTNWGKLCSKGDGMICDACEDPYDIRTLNTYYTVEDKYIGPLFAV